MNTNGFLADYLWPSLDKLDRTFTHLLPESVGLIKCGDFIIQCELEDTFSTNIITKYESDTSKIILKEVYKNTQNKVTGDFVRLVGTMSIVKMGYPFLVLDAGVQNSNPFTAEREDITTRISVHLPQADSVQRKIVFHNLSEQAEKTGTSCQEKHFDQLPDFWGTMWLIESKGIDLPIINQFRNRALLTYKGLIEETKGRTPFDYRPMQEYFIFNVARLEHLSFTKKGLSVPVEAQAAFFSVLVSGV
jgi:hypothetical protein